jgi:lipid-A-disaccharide synthase
MSKQYRVWILAGESSGDMYGARLARELRVLLGDRVSIAGMGSARMREAGVEILVDSTELGVVGIIEILGQFGTFLRIFFSLWRRARRERPDVVIPIDYPGFNLRFARAMYWAGIPVCWYISPQVWAWGGWRIPKLARYCRKMLVIFPFETETYAGTGLDVECVGHPLVDMIRERTDPTIRREPNRVLLLPGSRFSEIGRLFGPMLDTVLRLHRDRPDLRFTVAAPREKIAARLRAELAAWQAHHGAMSLPEVEITCGETETWMQRAGTGLAASGTVTIECAIAGLPLVVIYRINPITYWLGRRLVTLTYFTMANLIAGREVFREFLQEEVYGENLVRHVADILPDGPRRAEVEAGMDEVRVKLAAGSDNASRRAAEAVVQVMSGGNGSSGGTRDPRPG